jgi:hypothetical protein
VGTVHTHAGTVHTHVKETNLNDIPYEMTVTY